jgi:hypothetical protein
VSGAMAEPDRASAAQNVHGQAGFSIAPLERGEYDELAAYLGATPGEMLPADHWRRRMDLWWEKNPSFGANEVRGWTLRARGIVGFFGLVPSAFQVEGRKRVVYGSTTWRVDPGHRHNSLAAVARVLRHTRASLLFVSTHTAPLIKLLEAMKFVRLPRGECFYGRRPTTLPTRAEGIGRLVAGRILPEALLRGANPLVRLYPRLVAARLDWSSRGLVVRELARAGEDFDALWARTRAQHPTTNERSGAQLSWQCFAGSDQRKQLHGCYRGDLLVGYGVVSRQLVRGGSLVVHQCADLWADSGVPRVTEALVAALVRSAVREGADLLELPGFAGEITAVARRAGFLPRALSDRGEYVLGPKQDLQALNTAGAYFCLHQGDGGL